MNTRLFESIYGALRQRFIITTSAIFLGFTHPSSLMAASATWAGTGNTAWNIGANWNGGTSPGSLSGQTNSDTALFNNALSGVVTVDANRNLQTILFGNASGTGDFTLSGGGLLLSAGGMIQVDSTFTGNATVTTGLTLQGNSSLINNGATDSILSVNTVTTGTGLGAVTLTLSGSANVGVLGTLGNNILGVISQGTGTTLAINCTGPGTWMTFNQNTYTGGTTLNGGTLIVSNTTPLGTAGAITIASSSTLRTIGAMSDASSRMVVNDGATFTYDTANNNSTWASALQLGASKTGSLTKTGLGTLTIALTSGAVEQYTGATTVNADYRGGHLQHHRQCGFMDQWDSKLPPQQRVDHWHGRHGDDQLSGSHQRDQQQFCHRRPVDG